MSTELTDQLRTASQLPPDLMLLKMENEQIFSVARMQPREPLKIIKQLKDLIEAYPEAADEAIYSKPVGTVHEIVCNKCGVKYEAVKIEKDTACPGCDSTERKSVRRIKKFAEGLSIRAAESIRSIFGYTRLATTTELTEDGKARITGTLVDYAAGNLTQDERVVSPYYKSRSGQMTRTPEDRFLNVTVKAEKSKLKRDIILDSVPNIVKALFRDECEKKLKQLVAPEIIQQKIVPAFSEYGINPEQLDKIIGRPASLGWKEEDRLQLRKILNALKNEETTARELLADLDEREPTKPAGPVSASDLTKPKKAKEPPAEEQPPKKKTQPKKSKEDEADAKLTERIDYYRTQLDMCRLDDWAFLLNEARAEFEDAPWAYSEIEEFANELRGKRKKQAAAK